VQKIKRFDMVKKPVKEKWFLTPLAYALSFSATLSRGLKINKVNMKGLKPPYLLLCTHHSFIDFKVTTHAIFPHRATHVVALDGFLRREWLLRNVGGVCKRKFTPQDTLLVKQIKYSLEKLKRITVLYPEACYSVIGTTAELPNSLAKMVKILKCPVVVLNMHGNFLTQPVWNMGNRRVPLSADMTQIITQNEIGNLTVDEINSRIHKAFEYDEFKYQYEHKIKIKDKNRTKGLHKVLYQCDSCHTEFEMDSKGTEIWCRACGKRHYQDEYGRLNATEGETKYPHIPDWYESQRAYTRKQLEDGTYYFEDEVYIESLPNAKAFIPLGEGKLIHTKDGFKLTGQDLEGVLDLNRETSTLYSVHIEFDYKLRSDGVVADAIVLSTLDDTYYIYPKTKRDQVTKLRFAVEEAYKIYKNRD
jgi:ribosomal protein L37AE/L43A